jgi:hypothetical protein
LIVGESTAIEIKATDRVSSKDLKGLRALAEEKILKTYIVVSRDPLLRVQDGIRITPWQMFLTELWSGSLKL